MNARVKMLRKQSVETQPHIYMERAKLMTEAYKLYDGSMSVPEMRATALKYYFERKSIEIAEGELIVGEKGETIKDTCEVTVKFTFWQWLIYIILFGFLWY